MGYGESNIRGVSGHPATGSRCAFIFSLENAVCKDSYRRQCREWPEKPIAPALTSVIILTDGVLYRENKRAWARSSCGESAISRVDRSGAMADGFSTRVAVGGCEIVVEEPVCGLWPQLLIAS